MYSTCRPHSHWTLNWALPLIPVRTSASKSQIPRRACTSQIASLMSYSDINGIRRKTRRTQCKSAWHWWAGSTEEKQPSRSRQGVSCMFSKSWFHEAWGKLIPEIASNDDIQDIFVITQYSKSLYCYVQSSFTFLWCSLKISKSFKETLFKFNYIWVTCYRLVVYRKVLMCSIKNII